MPDKAVAASGKYVYQKPGALVLLDYAFPEASDQKKVTVNSIRSKYEPLIDSTLIMNGMKLPNNRLVGLALQNSKRLNLTKEQTASLTEVCIAPVRQKNEFIARNPGGKYDSRKDEHEQLPKIFDDKQYKNLLALKFKDQAKLDAEEKWQQMGKEGLDKDVNTEVLKTQVFVYYLNRLIAKGRFAEAKELQVAQVKSIDGMKPRILKKLDAVQKDASRKEELKSALIW